MSNQDEVDPRQFLERMRTLSDLRDHEDAERVKKLEEELIQGRSERLARRAERARSLSPDKPTTPQSHRSLADAPRSVQDKLADTPTPAMEPPSQESAREESLQQLTGSPAQLVDDTEPKKPAPSAAALGRSGTLSWQQRRPQSASMRRPISVALGSPDRATAGSPRTSEPPSPERPASRTQIAQSLSAKDPSWFKQTADRGIGSAAYRKNQEDNVSEAGSISGRKQLPGMTRDSTAELEAASPPLESARSSGSVRSSALLGNRISATASLSGPDAESTSKPKSPLPVLDAQKFAPPSEGGSSVDGGDRGSVRGLAMSPTQGRISPDRPASPTKGMGGFVQSAIMKRSDSVSKRWSSQAPPSLSRQNSTLSNRGSTYGTLPPPASRPSTLSRDNSTEPSSRPSSSAGLASITKDAAESPNKPDFVKPALPRHSRSKSVASTFSEGQPQQDETSPPSPSKRWSPTKSSWLESALNKPESPKPQQPPPQQPAWMSELSRIKQQRGSVDFGKVSPLQSPPADFATTSGRSSPIKEVQLRPVSLRTRSESPSKKEEPTPLHKTIKPLQSLQSLREKPDSPKKEEPAPIEDAKSVLPSPKPKPVVGVKPLMPADESNSAADESVPLSAEPETPKSPPTTTATKPAISSSRFAKGTALSPAAVKPKPDTPPKKDFRATLKSRQPVGSNSKSEEVNELQNVFGKLRRTETKNYVAPDVLKNNILSGKNALNVTGGPKPSVRRDEFRDSLVSTKAAMLAKAQEEGSAAHKRTDSTASAKDAPTPEAIAARKNLGRSDSFSKPLPPKETGFTPEAIARRKSLRTSRPVVTEKSGQPIAPLVNKETPLLKSSKLADRFNPALANMLARGPPPMAGSGGTAKEDVEETLSKPAQEEKTGPAPELTHMTKGRARGPKRRAPGAKQSETKSTDTPQKANIEKVAPVATVPLVKTEHVLPSSEPPNNAPVDRTPARNSLKDKPVTPAKSPDLSKRLSKSPTPEPPKKPASLELKREVSSEPQATSQKSPFVPVAQSPKPVPSPSYSVKPSSVFQSRPLPTPLPQSESQALKEIAPPNTGSARKEEQSPDKPSFSVKNATALWGSQSTSSSPVSTKPKSPIKLPTRADEQAATENVGLSSPAETPEPTQPKMLATKPKPAGLGLGGLGSLGGLVAARSRESTPPKPYPSKVSPISPPVMGTRPQSEPFKESPAPEKPAGVFTEFFDEQPVTTGVLPENIDTVRILKTPPYDLSPNGKIRTIRKQIHEVTGDGKITAIHAHDEHVLFQDCIYLCIHTFSNASGSKATEVYLWAGNGVAESTIEDVQLFAKNYAKQNQGTLVSIRQGKETPNFLDALGGIIITRRGAFPPAKEYMLCGRRHLGRLVFDEVDYVLKSLCSGYTYIIATSRGKVYLWKGRGCCAEELAGARLMGMDLAPGGDFLEVEEGSEPAEMIQVFPPTIGKGPAIPRSADHWRYKASSERYQTRLFKIEQQQSSGWGSLQTPSPPKSPLPPGMSTKIVELMPFCQRDLEPEHIYVLDAYFEMYIIVGPLSRSQHHAFSTALMFAQEYVILAVTEEDRPIKPPTTILLEGVPRDMRAVFRHWDDSIVPAAGLMNGKLGRGKSLRIVSMEKAIEATRRR
ncbi:hypothetical protein DPSP01_012550 [Paraphaeosphaeria sporulosa]|uniref:Uncharacterized protein n=1 Tax=Paraphaeosphaeria sporulosa TaxID=1460663 RepID=A0A177C8E6_9PLEO|nr:uncharacterized protein CC84DRAFT_1165996 [Paraphaeosphaeria sporulosa]OAG03825.1 hypothetical protein CC84DRAFT_1165996 [Paraphaeosphaeria sporulosa]